MTPVAARIVLEVSCVMTIKHECRSSFVFCIPYVALRHVPDASCVAE